MRTADCWGGFVPPNFPGELETSWLNTELNVEKKLSTFILLLTNGLF